MTRYIYSFFIIIISYVNAYAVSAYPHKIIVQVENGDSVEIYMRGDEYQKFALTEDGYTLIGDSEGWWYATQLENGNVVKSSFKLMPKEDETFEIKQFKAIVPKGIIPKREKPDTQNETLNKAKSSVLTGERRALVILMQYSDLSFKKTREDFDALFNTLGYNENDATGSVRDFYQFASQGQLDYVSDIYGPYTSEYPMRYYGGNSLNGNDSNPMMLCVEAIRNLPNDFDYTLYDNNKDGLVDNVHIIFAGYGEEAGASADAIWAHEYSSKISAGDGVASFAGYSCSPELRGNIGDNITNIGVICHELGHALGAMDYYDTNYITGGEYEGTGKWDIMASGSWNDNGRTPSNFNPYVRSCVFGWNSQIVLRENQHVVMPRMGANNPEETIIYRIDTESESDYFLLENRQRYNFDAALPGEGLIIYHVHPDIEKYSNTNTINTTNPQGLYPVCASYSEPNLDDYGNINSDECPFPGSKNVTSFSPISSPSAVAWDGADAQISISNITMNLNDGSISFITGNGEESDTTDLSINKELVYKESFESDIADIITINSIAGNETWRIYKKGDFVMNPERIPNSIDGDKILMLYSSKSTSVSEAELIGPEIDVNVGENYLISFDICCNTNSTTIPRFDLFIEDEKGEYNIYSLNKIVDEWENISLPIAFKSDKFRYKLYGNIHADGIFIDNIKLYKEESGSSITPVYNSKSEAERYVYNLNGVFIGRLSKLKNLPMGFYLIRQDKTVSKLIIR